MTGVPGPPEFGEPQGGNLTQHNNNNGTEKTGRFKRKYTS